MKQNRAVIPTADAFTYSVSDNAFVTGFLA
jgi:hypothetical protein